MTILKQAIIGIILLGGCTLSKEEIRYCQSEVQYNDFARRQLFEAYKMTLPGEPLRTVIEVMLTKMNDNILHRNLPNECWEQEVRR